MTDLDKTLQDIRDRERKAPKGPWYLIDNGVGAGLSLCDWEEKHIYVHVPEHPHLDAVVDFVQESRTDLPMLLEMVEGMLLRFDMDGPDQYEYAVNDLEKIIGKYK